MPLHHHQYSQLHQQRNMNTARYHQMPSTGHLQQAIQPANTHYTNYYNGHQMVKSQSAPGLPYNMNHWVMQEKTQLRVLTNKNNSFYYESQQLPPYSHYSQIPGLLPRAPVVSHSSQSSIDNPTNYDNHVYENSPIRDPNIPGLEPACAQPPPPPPPPPSSLSQPGKI